MVNKILKKVAGGMVAAVMVFGASQANALTVSYGFDFIPTTGPENVNLEQQLYVDISDVSGFPNQVLFTFRNDGPIASFISDIYFDDGTLLGIASLIDVDDGIGGDSGVDFSNPGGAGAFPEGNNLLPPWETTAGFSADNDPAGQSPITATGIDVGESLGIIFDLQTGKTFADVLNAITLAGGVGGLRIGIHVQGIDPTEGSDSLVNKTICTEPGTHPSCPALSVVPLPAAFPLFATALGGLGLLGWRRRRKAAA